MSRTYKHQKAYKYFKLSDDVHLNTPEYNVLKNLEVDLATRYGNQRKAIAVRKTKARKCKRMKDKEEANEIIKSELK